MEEAYIQRIVAHHTTPREAGLVFAETKPKLAVYTHLVLLASETIPPATFDDLVAETRATYDGPLEVGEDLMSSRSAMRSRCTGARHCGSPEASDEFHARCAGADRNE